MLLWFMLRFIRKQNGKGIPVFIYIHPREIDRNQQRLDLPFWTSFIHYWGIRGCRKKVEALARRLRGSLSRMDDFSRTFERG